MIDKIVSDSYSKLQLNHVNQLDDSNRVLTTRDMNQVDVSLWKNMIFYKSVANVRQNVKKNDPKEKLANHYANIPSKIKAYIRRPVEGH